MEYFLKNSNYSMFRRSKNMLHFLTQQDFTKMEQNYFQDYRILIYLIILNINITYIIISKIAPMTKDKNINNIILRIKIQQMIKTWKKSVKKSKHRLNVLKQWYSTQKSYIEDIKYIQNNIRAPLLQKQLITEEEDRYLFPSLDPIISLSNSLLQILNGFIKNWHPHKTMIGEELTNFYKGFIIYREYCNNYCKGERIIKSIKNDKNFAKIQNKLKMDIESYLIKPVQRPPKYKILLREYQKALRSDHPDYEILTNAIQKYHEVIEQNNQSMDLQIRNSKLTDLDAKYGGIVNATRQFLFEQVAKSLDLRVKLYVCNDLIVITKIHADEKEEGYMKLYLDTKSFVQSPMDGKYFINKLYICGQKYSIHLNFFTQTIKQEMHKKISEIIKKLHQRQINRHSFKKKIKLKMHVLKFQDIKIRAQPQLRITVVGVQKRPISPVKNQTVYILKIKAPFPNNTFQYSYMTFDALVKIQTKLKQKYKNLPLPLLDDAPQSMSYYDIKKNKTKIIQYRELYIERFFNYIFRLQQLENQLEWIAYEIKINQQLWEVVTSAEACACDICVMQNDSDIEKYQEQKSARRSSMYSNNRLTGIFSRNSDFSMSSNFSNDGFCVFNSFMKTSKFVQTPNQQLDTLQRRLMWVDCKMGRIDYLLIPKENQNRNLKISIHFMSLKQNQKFAVWISVETKVFEIIQQIAQAYNIKSMRDFGLFIQYQDCFRLIDRDQNLWDIIKNNELNFELNQGSPDRKMNKEKDGAFWSKVHDIKKWGQTIIGGKKTKIYIKKYLFMDDQLQIKACQQNPQRYPILIEEVFYRFKKEILILSPKGIKSLCALYYILTNIDRIPVLTQSNFQVDKLQSIIPQSKWKAYLDIPNFQRDVFLNIITYWEKMDSLSESLTSSKLFGKIQIIYNYIINNVHNVIGWNSIFFDVTNYDPPTLPGNQTNLLLGINKNNLIIVRKNQIAPILQIPILKLTYKVTVFSIFIETSQRILRFDGHLMYDIKKLIEIYRNLAEKFDSQ